MNLFTKSRPLHLKLQLLGCLLCFYSLDAMGQVTINLSPKWSHLKEQFLDSITNRWSVPPEFVEFREIYNECSGRNDTKVLICINHLGDVYVKKQDPFFVTETLAIFRKLRQASRSSAANAAPEKTGAI